MFIFIIFFIAIALFIGSIICFYKGDLEDEYTLLGGISVMLSGLLFIIGMATMSHDIQQKEPLSVEDKVLLINKAMKCSEANEYLVIVLADDQNLKYRDIPHIISNFQTICNKAMVNKYYEDNYLMNSKITFDKMK